MFLAVIKAAYPASITWVDAMERAGASADIWADAVRTELGERHLYIESADRLSVRATGGKAPDGPPDPSVGDLMSIDAIPATDPL